MKPLPHVHDMIRNAVTPGKSRRLREDELALFMVEDTTVMVHEDENWIVLMMFDPADGAVNIQAYGSDMSAWRWTGRGLSWAEI